jgi:hypothetical protein
VVARLAAIPLQVETKRLSRLVLVIPSEFSGRELPAVAEPQAILLNGPWNSPDYFDHVNEESAGDFAVAQLAWISSS